ncbi:MAG: hypothetical protein ACRYFX_13965 [Janthinobacterium lividum]
MPLTEAERAARAEQREQEFMLGLAEQFSRDVEENRDMAGAHSTELLRLVSQLRHNRRDQEQARQWGHVEEELRLVTEARELEATAQHHVWLHVLCEQYGRAIGTKLSQHQIEPGMTEEMVLAVFGAPAEGALSVSLDDPAVLVYRYGSPTTGTIIALRNGMVRQVLPGTVSFAKHFYEMPDVLDC